MLGKFFHQYIYIAILFFTAITAACDVVGKRPFMMVQICVNDNSGILLLKSIMKNIAQSESMDFFDQSEMVQLGLNEIRNNNGEYLKDGTVYILVSGNLDFGLIAANVGLRKYQISIGFSEGKAPSEAKLFAQKVVLSLERNWPVQILPPDKGTYPMKECGP